MGSVAVKINFLTHSMAQGKKEEPLTRNGVPGPSSNIQEAVIQGFTARGKDVVSPHLISYYRFIFLLQITPCNNMAVISSQIYDLRVTIDDGYLNSETTYGQMEMIHKQLQKYFIESTLPQ